jgi:hypothetical protein
MARTFIRQETQIRKSDLYDDTIPPTLAAYETNPTQIEEDLNNIRSQLQNFLNRSGGGFPAGDWYGDLTAPVTFEGGTQRGINATNQQLHDLERKRVLVESFNPQDVPIGTQATGTLTGTANFTNGETVTTGTKTYTFQTVLTNVDGNVLIGASLGDSLNNLAAAIALGAGAGTLYALATTANTFVYAASTTATTLVLLAMQGGTAGNSIATTETAVNASFGGATLSGGVSTNVSILTIASMLPGNTTLAIGIVTTLGTVAAAQGGTFGNHSLTQVSGATITSPKNLVPIVDSVTRDPILSSGRRIYALFQSESVTDGSTADILTPNRVQLSYVRLDATGSILEAVPAGDVSGLLIHYSATERKALEDFNEQDFLRGSVLDVPAASTVTRQVAYDNQGTTPVELLTNATLDLNSAGITWAIRDLVNANLFRVVEGSGGGTSMVAIDTDVDTFDVSAVVNDFDQGLRVDTGGQRINLGETAGLIESTAANDLRVLGAGELYLDDGNQVGSTWTQTAGIKLSDTTAEWNTFETNFGEVSLLNAINQAYQNVARGSKVYANVTVTTNANLDVGGVAGGTNLDAQLPDMSIGSFLLDYDVFLNGELLRPGANAAANNDYYPGTSLPNGQLRFEFRVRVADVICVIPYI